MILQARRALRLRVRIIPRGRLGRLAVDGDVVVRRRALPRAHGGGGGVGEDGFIRDGLRGEVDVALDELEGVGLGDGAVVEGCCCVRHFSLF